MSTARAVVLEYEISYAYPSSLTAAAVGRSKEGAYVLTDSGALLRGFDSFAQALVYAELLKSDGFTPSRWSLDHPKNAHLLSE